MKLNLKSIAKAVQSFCVKNHAEIMVGTGIASSIAAVALTIPATIKTKKALDIAADEKGAPLTGKEKFKVAYKYWLAPVGAEAVAVTNILLGVKDYRKANLALSTSLNLLETTIPEVVGEEKTKEIKEKVAEKRIKEIQEKTFEKEQRVVVVSEMRWFYEPVTGLIFQSTPMTVQAAINHVNDGINKDMYQCVGDLLDYLDVYIAHRDILTRQRAEEYGWNRLLAMPDEFKSVIKEGREVLILEYSVDPVKNYNWLG